MTLCAICLYVQSGSDILVQCLHLVEQVTLQGFRNCRRLHSVNHYKLLFSKMKKWWFEFWETASSAKKWPSHRSVTEMKFSPHSFEFIIIHSLFRFFPRKHQQYHYQRLSFWHFGTATILLGNHYHKDAGINCLP